MDIHDSVAAGASIFAIGYAGTRVQRPKGTYENLCAAYLGRTGYRFFFCFRPVRCAADRKRDRAYTDAYEGFQAMLEIEDLINTTVNTALHRPAHANTRPTRVSLLPQQCLQGRWRSGYGEMGSRLPSLLSRMRYPNTSGSR